MPRFNLFGAGGLLEEAIQTKQQENLVYSQGRFGRGAADYDDFVRINQAYAADDTAGQDLQQLLDRYFSTELNRLEGSNFSRDMEFLRMLNQGVDLGQVTQGLEQSASGLLGELSRPGGEIDRATRVGLDNEVGRGTGPASGGFEQARLNVIGRLNDQFSNMLAQQAPALFSTAVQNRLGTLGQYGSYLTNQQARADNLRESLFTGRSNIEALRMAQRQLAEGTLANRENLRLERKAQEGGGIGGFLGSLGGTILGSFAGPVGAAAGGKLGGSLFGGDGDSGGSSSNRSHPFGFGR